MRPPVGRDVDDVDDHRCRILRPGIETYQEVVAGDGASSLNGEPATPGDCPLATGWQTDLTGSIAALRHVGGVVPEERVQPVTVATEARGWLMVLRVVG